MHVLLLAALLALQSTTLPNGWKITPAGIHTATADMPLAILPTSDGASIGVLTSGFQAHTFSVYPVAGGSAAKQVRAGNAFYGAAYSPDEKSVFLSGGNTNAIYEAALTGESGLKTRFRLPNRSAAFFSGLAVGGNTLYACEMTRPTLWEFDLASGEARAIKMPGGNPCAVALHDGLAYVTLWSKPSLAIVNLATGAVSETSVGFHPTGVVVGKDGRVYVACAGSNVVDVLSPGGRSFSEKILTALTADAPVGAMPTALALSPDGRTLAVANSGNNNLCIVNVAAPGHSKVLGFIPTGWYPCSVAFSPDGRTLHYGSGKGLGSRPNWPAKKGGIAANSPKPYDYVGMAIDGSVASLPLPNGAELAVFTKQAKANFPLPLGYAKKTIVPKKPGMKSPIEYIIYVIEENRTYDQVFGDMAQGNGDPELVLFGEEVTPNRHALARDFELLDNLYVNGHVSQDGHPWSTQALATDFNEKAWRLAYSGQGDLNDNSEGNTSPGGYIWDNCAKHGLSYRSYGEYVTGKFGSIDGGVPGLVGHTSKFYGRKAPEVADYRDTDRMDQFLKEYAEYLRNGDMPHFIVMSLPEDHTNGTRKGSFTPQACVASNDLALGRLVEAVSKSKLWKKTAIFIIEDDAQNGPDHVDAHRTAGLVVSPYSRKLGTISSHYTTVSMLRTMELLLGLPPMTDYDTRSDPMFACFAGAPDTSAWEAKKPRIDLNVRNGENAYGASLSAAMDFEDVDRAPAGLLNEILWKAIKGEQAALPAPVRRSFLLEREVPGAQPEGGLSDKD